MLSYFSPGNKRCIRTSMNKDLTLDMLLRDLSTSKE